MINHKRIILLHGWGANTSKLTPLGQELHKLGWKTLLLELPGFDAPPPPQGWDVGDYAHYILQEAQRVFGKKEFFVFGHSFGGRLAIKLAAANADEHLAGIVLCSTSGLSRGNPIKRAAFWTMAKAGKILRLVPPVAEVWRKILYKLTREHDYSKTEGTMRETFKKVVAEDLKPLVRNIQVPTLVLWGQQDQVTPVADARYIQKTVQSAQVVFFANEGHQLPYHKPQELAQEINQWVQNLD
ncbi:alpha/beta hydrolase [Candidatus Parcubacteria bacterium]|nr:alpha/beta hydrolase [Candidatus Parcubacteria bacterium]